MGSFQGTEDWPLQSGTFSGTFDFDAVAVTYSNVSISTSAGVSIQGNSLSGKTYIGPVSWGIPSVDRDFMRFFLTDPGNPTQGAPVLWLVWSTSLDGFNTVGIDAVEGVCSAHPNPLPACDGMTIFRIDGTGTATPRVPGVPESSTGLLLLTGIVGLGARRRRRTALESESSSRCG